MGEAGLKYLLIGSNRLCTCFDLSGNLRHLGIVEIQAWNDDDEAAQDAFVA